MISKFRLLLKDAGYQSLDFYAAGLLSVSAFALYLCFPTRCYVLEGLARAIPMELRLFPRLLLGNYLLYGLIGNLFYLGLQSLGISIHAYVALQIMDGILGAAGLFCFYLILRAAESDRYFSCVWTVTLGCSLGYWMWSTEAENYILSTLLLQANFLCLILNLKIRSISPWILGGFQALAVFGHLVNGLFVIVGLWFFISTYPDGWLAPFLKYVTACLGTLVAGFGTALLIVRVGDWHHGVGWILGSAGGPGGKILWHGSGWTWRGLCDWSKMTGRIFISFFDSPFTSPPAWPLSSALLKAAAVLLVFFLLQGVHQFKKIGSLQKTILGACGLWVVSYGAIFSSWEPNTMVYRVSDLIPMVTVLAILCQLPRWRAAKCVMAAALALLLAAGNFGAEVGPRSHWENNSTWVLMQFVKLSTERNAWVTGNGGVDNIYIPYFAERRPLVLNNYRDQPEQLKTLLARIWSVHGNIYATSKVLADPYWRNFFRSYALTLRSQNFSGAALYKVKPRTTKNI